MEYTFVVTATSKNMRLRGIIVVKGKESEAEARRSARAAFGPAFAFGHLDLHLKDNSPFELDRDPS